MRKRGASQSKRNKPQSVEKNRTERNKAPKNVFSYLKELGAPFPILLFSIPLFQTQWFFGGVILFALSLAWLCYDHVIGQSSIERRVFTVSIYFMAAAFFLSSFVFQRAEIFISMHSSVPSYGEGTKVAGIEWSKGFAETIFSLRNPTDLKFDDLIVKVSTDQVIYGIAMTGGVGSCSVSSEQPHNEVKVQNFRNGLPEGPMGIGGVTVEGKKFFYEVVPIYPGGKIGNPIGTDKTFIIKCDQLTGSSHLDFVAVTSVLNETVEATLHAPPRPVNWIKVEMQFRTTGRLRKLKVPACWNSEECFASEIFDY